MNVTDFDAFVTAELEAIQRLQKIKGQEYSGEADRLSNFKDEAAALGVTPLQILSVYASKHHTLVKKYIRCKAKGIEMELSEPIEGRFRDIIVYALLGMALVAEEEAAAKAEHNRNLLNLSGESF